MNPDVVTLLPAVLAAPKVATGSKPLNHGISLQKPVRCGRGKDSSFSAQCSGSGTGSAPHSPVPNSSNHLVAFLSFDLCPLLTACLPLFPLLHNGLAQWRLKAYPRPRCPHRNRSRHYKYRRNPPRSRLVTSAESDSSARHTFCDTSNNVCNTMPCLLANPFRRNTRREVRVLTYALRFGGQAVQLQILRKDF